jgi:PEP-CTERM motif
MQGKHFLNTIGLAMAIFVAFAGGADAQVTSADVGVNKTFEQIGPSTVTSTGGFFSARAFFNDPGDYLNGTVTFSGPGSPVTLGAQSSPTGLIFGEGASDFAALQAKYPNTDYNFELSGGSAGDTSFTIPYAGTGYSLNTPELAAASFSALQGMNAGAGLVVSFNAFAVSPDATDNELFFSITNTTTMITVFSPALALGTTEVTIPGGTLVAGQSYSFDLNFSGRIVPEGSVPETEFYDTHTDGSFSTAGAVPEPTTWALLLLGFMGIGLMIRRRATVAAQKA